MHCILAAFLSPVLHKITISLRSCTRAKWYTLEKAVSERVQLTLIMPVSWVSACLVLPISILGFNPLLGVLSRSMPGARSVERQNQGVGPTSSIIHHRVI